jgi:hypothetical protein
VTAPVVAALAAAVATEPAGAGDGIETGAVVFVFFPDRDDVVDVDDFTVELEAPAVPDVDAGGPAVVDGAAVPPLPVAASCVAPL